MAVFGFESCVLFSPRLSTCEIDIYSRKYISARSWPVGGAGVQKEKRYPSIRIDRDGVRTTYFSIALTRSKQTASVLLREAVFAIIHPDLIFLCTHYSSYTTKSVYSLQLNAHESNKGSFLLSLSVHLLLPHDVIIYIVWRIYCPHCMFSPSWQTTTS